MLLTKSNFLIGIKCPRCFWKAMNGIKPIELSPHHAQNIKNGIEIGNLAKKLFKNSLDLSNMDVESNIEKTRKSLKLNNTIFEAGIKANNFYARLDIFEPCENGSWNIIEVKSTTEVKEEYIYDVAFQKYVCEMAGIRINQCFLLYINGLYIKDGDMNLEEFFKKENIIKEVEKIYDEIPLIIEDLMKIAILPQIPKLSAKPYFFKDYPCEFKSECWSTLPKHNVSNLYNIRKKKVAELLRKGIVEIWKVPDKELNAKQLIQKRAIIEDKVFINKEGIKSFIDRLKYPIYYLDFETYSEPIPRYENCKPYTQIPFQYSIHIEKSDGKIEHHEFLHKNNIDPRKKILKSLIEILGDTGSIVVFNDTFEKTRLKELSKLYPECRDDIEKILERIIDLLVPFSEFHYYNPIQQGSCSIKKVLPAVTGVSYDGMTISNGEDASTLYFKATFGHDFSSDEKEKVYSDLLKYCNLDTEGMVWIINELKNLIHL